MQDEDEELVKADDAERLKRRIEGGMNIEAEDGGGWTLLHVAAFNGSVECAKV